MVSKIFHVVASDQYAGKNSSPNTLHLGPSQSIISKRQLPVSSTIDQTGSCPLLMIKIHTKIPFLAKPAWAISFNNRTQNM